MNQATSRLAWASVLGFLVTGCVSSGKYDAALHDAASAHAETARTKSEDAAKIQDLEKRLDASNATSDGLRAELERVGASANSLSAEKGTLSSALGESRARLEELRRAQAASESRARLYRDVALRLKKMVDAGDLSIALRDGRMVLQLPNDVLFESGQVDIKPRGQAALKQVGAVLKTIDGRHFQVAGHTDNVPIDTSRYPSNWELSTARGVEVVRFLIAQGVSPALLAAAGYGEFDPITGNDTPKGRMRNRRIEITVQPNVDEIVSVPELH